MFRALVDNALNGPKGRGAVATRAVRRRRTKLVGCDRRQVIAPARVKDFNSSCSRLLNQYRRRVMRPIRHGHVQLRNLQFIAGGRRQVLGI